MSELENVIDLSEYRQRRFGTIFRIDPSGFLMWEGDVVPLRPPITAEELRQVIDRLFEDEVVKP